GRRLVPWQFSSDDAEVSPQEAITEEPDKLLAFDHAERTPFGLEHAARLDQRRSQPPVALAGVRHLPRWAPARPLSGRTGDRASEWRDHPGSEGRVLRFVRGLRPSPKPHRPRGDLGHDRGRGRVASLRRLVGERAGVGLRLRRAHGRLARGLFRNVEELELSVRASNCLKSANIRTIAELVPKTEAELLKTKNFGKKSLNEIKTVLGAMGVSLDTRLDPEERERLRAHYARA